MPCQPCKNLFVNPCVAKKSRFFFENFVADAWGGCMLKAQFDDGLRGPTRKQHLTSDKPRRVGDRRLPRLHFERGTFCIIRKINGIFNRVNRQKNIFIFAASLDELSKMCQNEDLFVFFDDAKKVKLIFFRLTKCWKVLVATCYQLVTD